MRSLSTIPPALMVLALPLVGLPAQVVRIGAPTATLNEEFSDVRGVRELRDGRLLVSDYIDQRVVLVDMARGSVVDEDALANALSQRQIAAAGLDVYEREPAVPHALTELENVVLLPHLGSATLEARTAMGMQMADNLDAFFTGRTPPNRVA